MTDIPFSYNDYKEAREQLLELINGNLSNTDKEFLLSFEAGTPDWSKCSAGDLSAYPSVQWKLLNIDKLKKSNPKKFNDGIAKLCGHLRL